MSEACADCGEYFGSPSDLTAHMRTVPSGGDPEASLATNPESSTPGLVCALCGRRFTSRDELAGTTSARTTGRTGPVRRART